MLKFLVPKLAAIWVASMIDLADTRWFGCPRTFAPMVSDFGNSQEGTLDLKKFKGLWYSVFRDDLTLSSSYRCLRHTYEAPTTTGTAGATQTHEVTMKWTSILGIAQ